MLVKSVCSLIPNNTSLPEDPQLAYLEKNSHNTKNIPLLISEISILLRRVALLNFSQTQVASLYDKAWLEFLDKTGSTTEFTQGSGRLLISAPYQAQADYSHIEINALFSLARQWITVVKKNPLLR